ncbi:MAG: exopolysaccharide transport family protein [Pseudomonadota bacterium]
MTELAKSFSSVDDRRNWAVIAPKSLTLRDLITFLRKRMLLIATCGLLAAAVSAWVVSGATPLYQAGGQLLLGEQGRNTNSSELLEAQLLNNSVIEGELAILRSSTLLSRVVDRLDLMGRPEFNPDLRPPETPSVIEQAIATGTTAAKEFIKSFLPSPPGSAETDDAATGTAEDLTPIQRAAQANPESQGPRGQAIRSLRGAVSVRQQGASFVVAVRTTTPDPEISAAVANTLMTEYIRFTSEKRFQAAQRFAAFLEQRVEDLGTDLEASEREALAFRAVIESNADSSARLEQQMRELTSKLVDARAQLAEADARLRRVSEIRNTNGLLAAADVLNSGVILDLRAQLSTLNTNLNGLTTTFGEDTRQATSLRRSIQDVENTLAQEVERTILELENTAQTLDINVEALETSLRSLEGLILTRSQDQIRLNQLTKVAEANRDIYQDFLGRYKQTVEIQNLQSEDAEVLSFASPPGAPSSPNKKVAVVLAAIGGLFAGVAVAFLLEIRAKRVTSTLDLAEATGLLNLGSLPRFVRKIGARSLLRRMAKGPNTGTVRAAQILLKNADMQGSSAPKSILVTGQEAGRGKSNLALMMAQTAAANGRACLLIDADTRNATLTEALGVFSNIDLTKIIYDNLPMSAAAQIIPEHDFHFIPTAKVASDPAMIFETRRAKDVFETAMETYDLVIIDAPPLTHQTELFALSKDIDLGIVTAVGGKSLLGNLSGYMQLFRKLRLKHAGAVMIENTNKSVAA